MLKPSVTSRFEKPPVVAFNEDLETSLSDIAGPSSKEPKTASQRAETAARSEVLMVYFDSVSNRDTTASPEITDIIE